MTTKTMTPKNTMVLCPCPRCYLGAHDQPELAEKYRRVAELQTEAARLREEVDLLKAANSDVRRIADERNKAEKEIKDIRAALGDDGRRTHRIYFERHAEGQDPAGTIWEHADKLQRELAEKTNEVAKLRKENNEFLLSEAALSEELKISDDWLRHTRNEVARLREALQLIACPERPDGTYNRGREACELLAKEALKAEIK